MASLARPGLVDWSASQLLQRTAPLGRDVSSNGTARTLIGDAEAPTDGPADADLIVVIFTDYQCPACRRASPELDAAYASDSHVRLIHKKWPIFGAASEQAARVALTANRPGHLPESSSRADARTCWPGREILEADH